MTDLSLSTWFETVTVEHDLGHVTVAGASSKPDHVCYSCRRQHRHDAKTFDAVTRRCRATKSVPDCRTKPVTCKPHAWVGKGSCCLCGAVTPRGQRKCKNAAVCTKRAIAKLTTFERSAEWETTEYERVMAEQHEPAAELAVAA